MSLADGWVHVASLDDFGESRKLVRTIGNQCVLLCQQGKDVVAVNNVCTHLGKPLDGGRIMGGFITCPFHGARFDLRTGRAESGPAVSPIKTYAVRVENRDVLVKLGDA